MSAPSAAHRKSRPLWGPREPEARRNFWLCVSNGGVTGMGQAFFAWETVMAGFVYSLTGSPFLTGLWATIATIGWQWPQLFVGSIIEHRPRKMPTYNLTVAIRLAGMSGMLVALLLLHESPGALYWVMLACLLLFSSGGGICVVPFFDIVSKTIPHQHRSMLFAWRRCLTGGLGFATGAIVYLVLSDRWGLVFPYNYALLFVFALCFNSIGYLSFMLMREPVEAERPSPVPFRHFLRRGPALFRDDKDFRLFYLLKLCLALGSMCQVLYVPFVMTQFNAPLNQTGIFAAVVALIGGLATILWGRIATQHSEVHLLRIASGLMIVAPLTALAMSLATGVLAQVLALIYLPMAFFLFGCTTVALAGTEVGGTVYMLSLPPPDRRATYIAFLNTLSAPFTLFPALAGWLATYAGYGLVFGISMCSGIAATFLALQLRLRSTT